ncbi:MAG: DUF4491 family protein [Bacteroidaceae bacterium]|nr:DUF4491 family protein [Bacteroidaceae bacterium]
MLLALSFTGALVGLCTFVAIGLFHPIVIKTEYYFGTRPWWVFLLAGVVCIGAACVVGNLFASTMLGVVGFSCFWSIHELFEQKKRVERGWFPRNPKRA